jgi:hypothetical protein
MTLGPLTFDSAAPARCERGTRALRCLRRPDEAGFYCGLLSARSCLRSMLVLTELALSSLKPWHVTRVQRVEFQVDARSGD